ncbi:MAG: GNAT family N-acetyltransferase [Alphaproteobacteria bacterium PA2]|nr:MAG: GNAT family N-acetyltransferase [Alphaproteobacteria bacterium PA2]
MIIRPSTEADVEALAAIYGHHVLHGFGTFDEIPPSPADMLTRRAAIVALGLPHLVAEADGRVLGYAYASAYRPRTGYRYTAEDSVYVAPDAIGMGVGRAVLTEVIRLCEEKGLRQIIAVIGDSGNAASIGLHTALGFEPIGAVKNVGFKHGRWVDTYLMQLSLNGGATVPPDNPGLKLGG